MWKSISQIFMELHESKAIYARHMSCTSTLMVPIPPSFQIRLHHLWMVLVKPCSTLFFIRNYWTAIGLSSTLFQGVRTVFIWFFTLVYYLAAFNLYICPVEIKQLRPPIRCTAMMNNGVCVCVYIYIYIYIYKVFLT